MRIVVIGFGPVGARFVEGMLPAVRAGAVTLTVLGAEQDDAYNRVLIAELAVGRATRERLDLPGAAAAAAAGASVRLGEAAVSIDRSRRVVHTSGGDRIAYDRLVLATGARANVPTLFGMEKARRHRLSRALHPELLDRGEHDLPRGVTALRDLADAEQVAAAVRAGLRIVVLGAGVLGLEVALAAREQGAEVVVVHTGGVPMSRNLDDDGGRMLARAARGAGVQMLAHAVAESIVTRTDDSGGIRFDALLCADGTLVRGDLLLLSVGASARVELAAASDLAVATGILVDERLASWTDPSIFAIGDCAQVAARDSARADGHVAGAPSGLIGPGWRQADALSAWLCGAGDEMHPLADRPAVVALKAEGVDVISGGAVDADPWDDDPHADACAHRRQVSQWLDPARGCYVKMVTRAGVLEGFVAVGMPRAGAELALLFERGGELPADRGALLRLDGVDSGEALGTDPFAPDATVCWCNGVTVQRISDALADGADTVECVGSTTRAGTGCGGCRGRIAELIARDVPLTGGARVG
ncbi:NAD(P)/FAD-dependent oxidoreductase [Microbacterium bovistercoris]|uniref:NAD(P)/FAD-dependent oxidoreductase n=1 Tax=Microbacterium bovistercoris TaxID=2293570 RepID=A0A371NQX8_9MICO|nr:FAD-dependent oxidoreductase [Microbacterium bovistercoris]REJ04583.1 NAD(P)/FAD-dependent oxidoreductase [Microbacterium bovistercoris]